MNNEIYKKHPYLEIEVSNIGNIRTTDRIVCCKHGKRHYKSRRLAKQRQTTNKSKTYYYKVSINIRPGVHKHFWAHRLVAETWIPNLDNYKYVNHIDGDGCNNTVENLEWCNNSQNVKHAIAAGKYSNIKYINGTSMAAISRELGDKTGHLVYKRLKKGWCIDCAISIEKLPLGGNRKTRTCPHN